MKNKNPLSSRKGKTLSQNLSEIIEEKNVIVILFKTDKTVGLKLFYKYFHKLEEYTDINYPGQFRIETQDEKMFLLEYTLKTLYDSENSDAKELINQGLTFVKELLDNKIAPKIIQLKLMNIRFHMKKVLYIAAIHPDGRMSISTENKIK